MRKTENIVCVSSIDWDFIWQGHQEIMSSLARAGNRVLFIENTGVRRPTLKDMPRIRKRLANWRSGVKGIRQVMDNLYVYSPLVLPFPYSWPARMVNRLLMMFTLRSWVKTMHFDHPIIWTWLPTALALDLIEVLNGKLTVYYCFDNFEAISKTTRKIRKTENALIRKADLVFATARSLFDHCAQFNPSVHLFPSGFSKRIFTDAPRTVPADVGALPQPIIGYVGGLHKVVDFELLRELADANRDKSLVLVGPIQADVGRLAACPNVYFLGQKKHEELPNYIASFSVCLIPYVLNEYTRNVYPTKLNEYLIMGKPVVSTRLPELERFDDAHPGTVSVAASVEEFLACVERAIQEDQAEARARRIRVAESNTWAQKIEQMTALIDAKLEEKRKANEQAWQVNLASVYAATKRKALAIGACLLLLYATVFHTPLLWWIASPLNIADQPVKADVIVVLAGGIGESGVPGEEYQEKVKHGVELYRQSYAGRLLFSSGVGYVFKEAQVMKALAVSLGVPAEAIILEEQGGGNYASLAHARTIMQAHGWSSMLLVTSRYNTARSRLVVKRNFPEIEVYLTPADQSAFYGSEGTVAGKHVRAIAHEYLAIAYYWWKDYI